MKIINAVYEILTPLRGIEEVQFIEKVARTCYKSEDKITEDGSSARKMVGGLIRSGHEAMLEHGGMTVKFTIDRGISHEIVRHRMASFAQESTRYCVAGDMKLRTSNPHNRPTVKELYDNVEKSTNGAWKRMKIEQYDEETGLLGYAGIRTIQYNGIRECLKIKTRLGYSLVCTPDHQILTDEGWVEASTLSEGDKVLINGTSSLYKNYDWLYNQSIVLNKTFKAIAEEFNFNVNTVKKWARKLGIPKKGTGYFNVGRSAWNKGIQDERQVHALRKYHHCGRRNDKILKEDTVRYRKRIGFECAICGGVDDLEVHHIDGNRRNNYESNLITLCASCHGRVHSQNLTTAYADTVVSIDYAGEKDVYDIEMDSNSHNFIANGIVVHNCNYSKDKFGKEITVILPNEFHDISEERRFRLMHNARWDEYSSKDEHERAFEEWFCGCSAAEKSYFLMLERGCSPQIARDVLPTSTKTELIMTANWREWRHVFDLRCAPDAHPQIREVMLPLLCEVNEKVPVLFEDIFEKAYLQRTWAEKGD